MNEPYAIVMSQHNGEWTAKSYPISGWEPCETDIEHAVPILGCRDGCGEVHHQSLRFKRPWDAVESLVSRVEAHRHD